jgi:hypothetical protein
MDQPPMTNRGPGETGASGSTDSRTVPVKLNLEQLQTACARGLTRQAGNLVLLSQMFRKPKLLQLWLTTARSAQIVLVAGILAATFLGPRTADWLSQTLYPTVYEEQRFFQRFTGNRTAIENPLRDVRRDQFLSAAWVLSLGAVLVLLLRNVPRAVSIGRQRATALLAKANELAPVDAEQSAHLRVTASGLLVNDEPVPEVAAAARAEIGANDPTLVARDNRAPVGEDASATVTATHRADAAPQYVGADRRYRLEKQMGGGGMGIVHAATDMLLDRTVALKQLYAHFVGDHEHSMRFRQEAMALASLTHPHIVTMHDLIDFDSHFWIVMELLPGGSLADRIQESGSLPLNECVEIGCAVASGLDYAHRHGVVHRDVKPMNILFTAEGIPKLADFGTAKLRESWIHTSEGDMLGSPAFMSPEQVTGGPVDPRTDVYCLGVSLYQMLTGKVPFDGDISSILAQHVNKQPDPPSSHNPAIPGGLDAVVLRMLEKAPGDRYQTARAAIDALRASASELPAAQLA